MIDIHRDNFDEVMAAMAPRVDLEPMLDAVPQLQHSGNPTNQVLVFGSLGDFEPFQVIAALPALHARYRARGHQRQQAGRTGSKLYAMIRPAT